MIFDNAVMMTPWPTPVCAPWRQHAAAVGRQPEGQEAQERGEGADGDGPSDGGDDVRVQPRRALRRGGVSGRLHPAVGPSQGLRTYCSNDSPHLKGLRTYCRNDSPHLKGLRTYCRNDSPHLKGLCTYCSNDDTPPPQRTLYVLHEWLPPPHPPPPHPTTMVSLAW